MFLKVIGIIWMIVPILILSTSNGDTSSLISYSAVSFILGLLCFKASPKKEKKMSKNSFENEVNLGSKKKKSDLSKNHYSRQRTMESKNSNLSNKTPNYAIEVISSFIRNQKDYPGETARILTESYFGIAYEENDLRASMENLINFRSAAYGLQGLNLEEKIISKLATDYCDNFPIIILALSYFEIFDTPSQKKFFEERYPLIYTIIKEEHIKVAKAMKKVPVVSETSNYQLKEVLGIIKKKIFFNETEAKDSFDTQTVYEKLLKMKESLYDFDPSEELDSFQKSLYGNNEIMSEEEQSTRSNTVLGIINNFNEGFSSIDEFEPIQNNYWLDP